MLRTGELREYRAMVREERELRAQARLAERCARESGQAEDTERARASAAMYEAIADETQRRLFRIEAEVSGIERADVRSVIRLRFLRGYSRARVAAQLHMSESNVAKLTRIGCDLVESQE